MYIELLGSEVPAVWESQLKERVTSELVDGLTSFLDC